MPLTRPNSLGLEAFEDRLVPSAFAFAHAPDPQHLISALTRATPDDRIAAVASALSAERVWLGVPEPALLAAVRPLADVRAALGAFRDTAPPEPGAGAKFLNMLTSFAEERPREEGAGDAGPRPDVPLPVFFFHQWGRELPPSVSLTTASSADAPTVAGAHSITAAPDQAGDSAANTAGGAAARAAALGGTAAGGADFDTPGSGLIAPVPRPEANSPHPAEASPPQDIPAGPSGSEDPLEAEIPSGVPIARLLANQLTAFEQSARAVLDRLPGGQEVADLLVESDQYLWLTGAILVTAAAVYAARPAGSRAGDRVTLGTDSVVANREDERRGERASS